METYRRRRRQDGVTWAVSPAWLGTPAYQIFTKLLIVRDEHGYSSGARLLIVPGNHGDYLGELVAAAGDPGPLRQALPFLVNFLDQPEIITES